jgi:hypothetical protein
MCPRKALLAHMKRPEWRFVGLEWKVAVVDPPRRLGRLSTVLERELDPSTQRLDDLEPGQVRLEPRARRRKPGELVAK